jgi:GT2 family glycosyltransferase
VPEISIVIPTLGLSQSLDAVLVGLEQQEPQLDDAEVLVVTDAHGTSPSSLATSNSARPFELNRLQATCPGASGTRNVGWNASKAPLTLFLDDDIVPSKHLVAEHRAWHQRHPEPGVGVLGKVRWSPQVKVTPFMRWLEMGIAFDYGGIDSIEARWQRFYSCNVSVKRAMLERVGGFDEQRFPFGYEDLELARRMSDHGFRLLYNSAAVGEHLKTETLDGWRGNLRRIAQAERRFAHLYPGERAYFYERFRAAAAAPVARGRSARLARFVRPGVPWLGPIVWSSYDLVCRQQLAPEFLAEWDAASAVERD